MKKERKKKKKRKKFEKLIEGVVTYLQGVQNAGGCGCGREGCPLNLALFLIEYCEIPIKKVAKIFILWRIRFLEDLIIKMIEGRK